MQMEDKIYDVMVPMEEVMELKVGKRQVVQKKVFPGYLLVQMIYDNDSWYVVRNTPGVTGFVSRHRDQAHPASTREVEKILAVEGGRRRSRSPAGVGGGRRGPDRPVRSRTSPGRSPRSTSSSPS